MLKQDIISYWSKRSSGYSQVNKDELAGAQNSKWLSAIEQRIPKKDKADCKVLDIGTGPGFFAIILATAGYNVTAVDFSEKMLAEARLNAGNMTEHIEFLQMDAQQLAFEDDTFDVIITRNLTWNLNQPKQAYMEWIRVLKKGGSLLNFDANWYCYLFDENKRKSYNNDREQAAKQQVIDFYEGTDIDEMERIARSLPLSHVDRPKWDSMVLSELNVSSVTLETEVWQEVWSDEEKLNFTTTPMFLVNVKK